MFFFFGPLRIFGVYVWLKMAKAIIMFFFDLEVNINKPNMMRLSMLTKQSCSVQSADNLASWESCWVGGSAWCYWSWQGRGFMHAFLCPNVAGYVWKQSYNDAGWGYTVLQFCDDTFEVLRVATWFWEICWFACCRKTFMAPSSKTSLPLAFSPWHEVESIES